MYESGAPAGNFLDIFNIFALWAVFFFEHGKTASLRVMRTNIPDQSSAAGSSAGWVPQIYCSNSDTPSSSMMALLNCVS